MPYNTRRKSLSLPALGIHLPVTHASRAAARLSPPSAGPNLEDPPSKKMKRSHEESPSMSPPPKRVQPVIKYETTPPPSPKEEDEELEDVQPKEIDLEGINDDIVEAVIIQLQKTGNRPHLVKELAAILGQGVKIVEQSVVLCLRHFDANTYRSANPSAIISSRLSSYIKRPWTALARCPLAKELETVHPRRTYYYLTTYRHQPIPDPSNNHFVSRAVISPSISSAASRSDEADTDAERRRELSPSPEVDLSSPEFDDATMISPPTPSGSFSGRVDHMPRNNRATSPPLEKDEKEFTQTARGMQKRKMSQDLDTLMGGVPSDMDHPTTRHNAESDTLFGDGRNLAVATQPVWVSSPAMKPSLSLNILGVRKDSEEWSRDGAMDWDLRSPEHVELEELEGMFDDF